MDYTSADFKIQYISSYTLYVNSDWTTDQVVVLDSDNRVLLAQAYDSAQPSQEVAKLLSLPFTRVYVTLPHQRLMWVPTEVFQHSSVAEYATFFDTEEHILSKEMANLGVTALYQFDLLLYNRWKRIFPEAHFVPVFEVTIQQVQPQIPIRGSVLGAYVYDQQVDLFLFVDGAFCFYNTFEVATVDDLSYFVLQLLKNFDISDKVNRVLLGGVDLDSEWAGRLGLYSEDVQLIQAKTRWTVGDAVPNHVFHIMADSVLCVS